jgi:hypothetical protein
MIEDKLCEEKGIDPTAFGPDPFDEFGDESGARRAPLGTALAHEAEAMIG